MIITPGESYAEQCSGERELTIKLEPGVYHIVVHPYCTLTGDDWKIRGLITRHSNHTIDDLIVDLDPINLDFNITVPDIHHAYKLPWMPLKELRRLNIQPIKPEDTVPYTNAETHLTSTVPTVWVNLVLTCLAIAALLIIGRFLYKRYKKKPLRRQKTAADVHASDSMLRIEEIDDEEPPENDVVKEPTQCRQKCHRNLKSTEPILLDARLAEATYSVPNANIV